MFNQKNSEYFSMISGVTCRLLLKKIEGCDDLFIFYFGRWMCATLVSDFEKCLRAPVSQLRQWRLKAVCTFLAVCHFTALSRALLPQLNLFYHVSLSFLCTSKAAASLWFLVTYNALKSEWNPQGLEYRLQAVCGGGDWPLVEKLIINCCAQHSGCRKECDSFVGKKALFNVKQSISLLVKAYSGLLLVYKWIIWTSLKSIVYLNDLR